MLLYLICFLDNWHFPFLSARLRLPRSSLYNSEASPLPQTPTLLELFSNTSFLKETENAHSSQLLSPSLMQWFLWVPFARKDREGPRGEAEISVPNAVIYCNQPGTIKAKHKHISGLHSPCFSPSTGPFQCLLRSHL